VTVFNIVCRYNSRALSTGAVVCV